MFVRYERCFFCEFLLLKTLHSFCFKYATLIAGQTYSSGNLLLAIFLTHLFQYNASDVKLLIDFDKLFAFWLKMEDFDSTFTTTVDSSLEKSCLFDEPDNPMTVTTLSSLIELKEWNEKHKLRSFDEADKDYVEKYLYAYQNKFFVKIVSMKKVTGLFTD